MRAVALAGDLGQRVQAVGRLTADHLYVYDGDLKNQDRISQSLNTIGDGAIADGKKLTPLVKGTSAETALNVFNSAVQPCQVRMVESTRTAVQEAARAAGASAEAATQTAEAAEEARRVARQSLDALVATLKVS